MTEGIPIGLVFAEVGLSRDPPLLKPYYNQLDWICKQVACTSNTNVLPSPLIGRIFRRYPSSLKYADRFRAQRGEQVLIWRDILCTKGQRPLLTHLNFNTVESALVRLIGSVNLKEYEVLH
jgi:hypothetical protein